MPEKLWVLKAPPAEADLSELGAYLPVVAQLLYIRGHRTRAAADAFLAGELLVSDDPFLLSGLPETVYRLQHAIRQSEKIAIYGDYDTDGVTATALLVQVLRALDADVREYIPDRETEGYGLNHDALRKLKDDGFQLVVTVDCGVRSVAEAETAREIRLDLVITDHHTPGPELPRALAVVNPRQQDDAYPYKDLAGVGLAYKIAQGLIRPLTHKPLTGSDVLDLVALGTVADLASLTGENRRLVRQGLAMLNKPRREGVKSLMEAARMEKGKVDASAIGFALGPRLNAAGRLESALAAYELLTTGDMFRANQLAQQLDVQNKARQALTRETHAKAREIALATHPNAALIFAADPGFRDGIVGLAAARLTEEFYRPAVVAHLAPDFTKGSARSIPDFHITEAFDQCRRLLTKHGGHAAAAGFTAPTANVDELADSLRGIAERELGGRDLHPKLPIDAEVPLSDLDDELLGWLQRFEPCGMGNPQPVLASRGLKVADHRTVGQERKHLKLSLTDGRTTVDSIAFHQGHRAEKLPARIDVAYCLEANEWNGRKRMQLNVKDIRASD